MCHVVSVKSALWACDHTVSAEKPSDTWRVSNVTTDITDVVYAGDFPPSQNSLLRKCGKWKLLIKDLPTLWLPQAVCRHLEPAASCPLKRKKQKTYWSVDGRAALYDKNPTLTNQREKTSLHLKMYLLIHAIERSVFDVCYFSTCKQLCWAVEKPCANSHRKMPIPPNTSQEPASKIRMWLLCKSGD